MGNRKKLLLGLAPTRRFVFSAEDAARYKVLVEQKLKEWNVEFITIDSVNPEGLLYERKHAAAAAELFKNAGVDAVFCPHVNFGTEEVVTQLARDVGKPFLLWGPRDEELPNGNHLRDTQCGTFATANVLKKYGVKYSWIVNSRLDDPVFERGVKTFLSAVSAAKSFLGARVGQVSTRPPNFYTVIVNEQDLLLRWGIEMAPVDLVVLSKRVLEIAASDPRAKEEAGAMRARVTLKGINDDALLRMAALKLHLADWAEQEELDAIAFKCHDDLPDALGIYPCFINGELASMNIPVACETDIHGALSALLLGSAAQWKSPPFLADLTMRHPTNDNAELLWHCGNFPHALVREPNVAFLGTHFTIPPHRPGTGNFQIKGGDITVARFDGVNGAYSLLMGHGRGTEGPFSLGTYLWMEVPDWPLWEERIVRGPYIHHVAGIHGQYAPALHEATRYIPGLAPDPVQPTTEQIGAWLRGVLMDLYAQLGFASTREMFRKAYQDRYAVPAFNFVCLEQLLAIVDACMETRSPFILQCSANVRRSLGPAMVRAMAQGAIETMKRAGRDVPMALHLDHGTTEEDCRSCVNDGFSSVMIDGSALPYEENVALSARVAAYAHAHGVTVEGELGVLSGTEEGSSHAESRYTDPAAVIDFVKRTSVDSLAVSIGTSHGLVKMKTGPGGSLPALRFDILEAIEKKLPGFPIVLHGASSLSPLHVETVNSHGGRIAEAQGIPEDQTIRAISSAVRKINIASDGWMAMTAAVRKSLDENRSSIDPRTFLSPARQAMKELYVGKVTRVMGSAGKGDVS